MYRPPKRPGFQGLTAPTQRSVQFAQRTGAPVQRHDGAYYKHGNNHKGCPCALYRGCFECGQKGHMSSDCSLKGALKSSDQKPKPDDSQKTKTQCLHSRSRTRRHPTLW